MKQKFKFIQLACKLGFMFIGEMYKVLIDEVKNNTYPQENYNSCVDRAMAMIGKAMVRPTRYCACLIAHHREEKHLMESHREEIAELEVLMPSKDVKSSRSTKVFWMV